MVEDIHQRDQSAMAPSDDGGPLGIEERVGLEHPPQAREHVVVLAAAVVDGVVESAAVAGRAAVVRRDDRVALLDQFPHDVHRSGREIGVHAAVRQHNQRVFPGPVELLRNEGVGADDHRVARAGRVRVRHAVRRQAGVGDLVDFGDVAQARKPRLVVNRLQDLVPSDGPLVLPGKAPGLGKPGAGPQRAPNRPARQISVWPRFSYPSSMVHQSGEG